MERIDLAVKEFADVTYKHFDGYGFAVGYLQSVICQHFAHMPKYVQESIIRSLNDGTEKYKSE